MSNSLSHLASPDHALYILYSCFSLECAKSITFHQLNIHLETFMFKLKQKQTRHLYVCAHDFEISFQNHRLLTRVPMFAFVVKLNQRTEYISVALNHVGQVLIFLVLMMHLNVHTDTNVWCLKRLTRIIYKYSALKIQMVNIHLLL